MRDGWQGQHGGAAMTTHHGPALVVCLGPGRHATNALSAALCGG